MGSPQFNVVFAIPEKKVTRGIHWQAYRNSQFFITQEMFSILSDKKIHSCIKSNRQNSGIAGMLSQEKLRNHLSIYLHG
jgi:hypothetical protein